MARRKYVVTGTQAVIDPDTGERVERGGELTADSTSEWVEMQLEAGVLLLEADTTEAPTMPRMRCPLCIERDVKRVPAFANQGELEAHYTSRHAGFVVPAFEPEEA